MMCHFISLAKPTQYARNVPKTWSSSERWVITWFFMLKLSLFVLQTENKILLLLIFLFSFEKKNPNPHYRLPSRKVMEKPDISWFPLWATVSFPKLKSIWVIYSLTVKNNFNIAIGNKAMLFHTTHVPLVHAYFHKHMLQGRKTISSHCSQQVVNVKV